MHLAGPLLLVALAVPPAPEPPAAPVPPTAPATPAPIPPAAPAAPAAPIPPAAPAAAPRSWSLARTVAPGPARAIGRTGAGCLQGGVALPMRGNGFRVLHPERGRAFGHPDLVAAIREWGVRLRKLGLPALGIGDLSQPRGGPAPTGHASHQTGLDVDVAY